VASGKHVLQYAVNAKIVNEKPYDGFERKVVRLGLVELIDEVKALISQFDLLLLEERDRNSSAAVRRMLDARFTATPGWRKIQSGGIDWTKCIFHNGAEVCVGVELQVSSRSDLLTNDLTHLTRAIEQGDIDAGIIVVPSDTTAYFLTDRVPRFRDALDHVDRAKAQFSPLLILSIGHDGPGPALPKMITNRGERSRRRSRGAD
jgi:hypothetical protein